MKAKMEVKLKLRQEDLFKKIRVLERKSLEGNNLLSVEPSSNDRSGCRVEKQVNHYKKNITNILLNDYCIKPCLQYMLSKS